MFETPNSINTTADAIGANRDRDINQRKTELDQEDFFALLTTQLAQQDPLRAWLAYALVHTAQASREACSVFLKNCATSQAYRRGNRGCLRASERCVTAMRAGLRDS